MKWSPLHAFSGISVPDWFHAFCGKLGETLNKWNQSTTHTQKNEWKTLGKYVQKRKLKKHWIQFLVVYGLYIHLTFTQITSQLKCYQLTNKSRQMKLTPYSVFKPEEQNLHSWYIHLVYLQWETVTFKGKSKLFVM